MADLIGLPVKTGHERKKKPIEPMKSDPHRDRPESAKTTSFGAAMPFPTEGMKSVRFVQVTRECFVFKADKTGSPLDLRPTKCQPIEGGVQFMKEEKNE